MPILQGRIVEDCDVYTDGWKAYDGLVTNGYRHHRIHHHKNELARGKNHVNGIESFWSYAKFRIAKLRGVRKGKFMIHLKESEWRFNHRFDNIYSILLKKNRHSPFKLGKPFTKNNFKKVKMPIITQGSRSQSLPIQDT